MDLKVGQFFSYAGQALKKVVGPSTPVPKEVLQKALFGNGPAVPQGSPALSGHSLNSVFVVSDYNSLYHATQDLALSLSTQFPHGPFQWVRDFVSSKDMAINYHAFGSLTGIHLIVGLVNMHSAASSIKHADAIGDKGGSLIGRISLIGGAALGSAGVSSAAFRVFSVIGTIKNAKPESLLGRLSQGFVVASLISYIFFFSILSTVFGIQMYEGFKLKNMLGKAEDLAAQVEGLQKKMQTNPDVVFEKLVKKHGSEAAARKALMDEAFEAGQGNLKKLLKELNIKNVSGDKLKEVVYKAVEAGVSGWTATSIQKQVEEQLVQIGLEMKVQKTQLKKQAKMERILNSGGMEAMQSLQSAKGLADRVRLGDKEAVQKADALLKVIKKANQKKLTEAAAVVGVLILGIVSMIASMVFTSGMSLLVISALALVFSILMTAVDGYYLLESYRQERPAPHDKKMLALSSILGVASLALILGLGLSGVVTMGVAPLVISLVLTGMWLGQNGVTWAVMNRNERRHNEKNPTFEKLLEALNANRQETVSVMLKNLSEAQREMIDAEMKKHAGDRKEAIQAVIQKVEHAKKAHLDAMREAVTPYLVRSVAN